MEFCTQLSVNLIIDALKTNKETNLVFSPMSYNVILNMIAGAASGSTLEEMLKFLQCAKIKDVSSNSTEMMWLATDGDENNSGGGPVMHCLNGIWLDQRYCFKPSYQELAGNIYNARVKTADFKNKADEVVKDANEWAKASTEGLVTEIIKQSDLDRATIVLGNALYFKGNWKSAFKPKYTENKPFYLMNGGEKSVPFMTGTKNYTHGSFDGYEVVQIPYQKGEKGHMLSMYIFLPFKRNGLEWLLHKVESDEGFLRGDFELSERASYHHFWIPKFKFSYYTSEGVKGMKKMGLQSPFDIRVDGGLTEMVNERISVERIVQKSFIEVDEKGTKAAAVTSGYATYSCPERKKFIANRPFLFMIREEMSKFILFTGVVLDPTVHGPVSA